MYRFWKRVEGSQPLFLQYLPYEINVFTIGLSSIYEVKVTRYVAQNIPQKQPKTGPTPTQTEPTHLWPSAFSPYLTLICKKFIRPMIKVKWGRVINISSVVGSTGNPGQANYVASKAALNGLTKSLALEVATRGITVNSISPGFIDTSMTKSLNR